MDAAQVAGWIAAYERAWRSPGTDGLAELFTVGATYSTSPYDEPFAGLPAIARMWESERGRCSSFEEWPFWPGEPEQA